ncbi:hypothetical protein [Lysobacter brunescens]|uniref:Uncharacterized protein n=1 Tax=Lysobacter brunescens TaxID=262323 RepID=A0ABW2YIU2_9GAMM
MKTEHKTRPSFRKTPLMAGLVLACGLFTGNSSAQWVVTDPGHTAGTLADMAQSWGEFMEQYSRWQRQLSEFQDALTQVTSIVQNPSLMLSNFDTSLRTIDIDHGAEMQCPAPQGSGFSFDNPASLFASLVPSANDDAVQKQWVLCNQIVRLKNRKYNDVVNFAKSAEARSTEVGNIMSQVGGPGGNKTEGAHRASMLRATMLMNQQITEMNYAQAKMAAYDSAVDRLQRESNGYAIQMLNGKKGLMGQAVSLAALKGALEIAD